MWKRYLDNDIPKNIYLIIMHKNQNEILWKAIFYYNSSTIYEKNIEIKISFHGDLYDIFEVTSNDDNYDIFDYIADASSLFK